MFLYIIWIFLQYLTPFVERERYQIPKTCRLHPDNDLYRDQELHKIHVDIFEWKCGYCKKSFSEEKFIDKHFATRHYNLLNTVCGILLLSSLLLILEDTKKRVWADTRKLIFNASD